MQSNENEAFLREQQQAVERMREMSRRSIQPNPHTMPPTPSFVRLPESDARKPSHGSAPVPTPTQEKKAVPPPHRVNSNSSHSLFSGLLPKQFSFDSDTALIIGLILLLSQENTDRMLLYALVYILL